MTWIRVVEQKFQKSQGRTQSLRTAIGKAALLSNTNSRNHKKKKKKQTRTTNYPWRRQEGSYIHAQVFVAMKIVVLTDHYLPNLVALPLLSYCLPPNNLQIALTLNLLLVSKF
jgi:hypothetical protein